MSRPRLDILCLILWFPRAWYDGCMTAKTHPKRLVLFDAHAIIHRAYHALPDFATKQGEPTGGIYGLSTMLLRAINEFQPDYMAACYDLPGPTFRHKEYKEYKAGRAKADDALVAQLIRSRDVFTALNIPIYDVPGFEADDMLGTIVEQTKKEKNLEVVIVTGDKDAFQLISGKRVRVYTLRGGVNDVVLYDEEMFVERYGFTPPIFTDFKGIVGDTSDNIIGIPGVGETSATKLLQAFGSIEGIYKALKKDGVEALIATGIRKQYAALVAEHEDEALFSKMLATIRRDAPIEFTFPEMVWKESFVADNAVKLFNELEFKSLAGRVRTLQSGKEPEVAQTTQGLMFQNAIDEKIDPTELRKAQIGLWVLQSDKTTPSLEDVLEYAGEREFAKAEAKIVADIKNSGLTKVYEDIELPLIPIIERAQTKGISVDVAYLKKLSIDYHQKLDTAEKKIYTHAGEEFNINSPKQLGVILFEKLNLSVKGLKKTDGGARSTRESELEKLRDLHPIIESILEYREVQKLLSTYIDNIPHMVDATGRIHTTLHQDGTTTGRFSSSNPNLQNIPVRDGLGEVIRDAFIAEEGCTLLAFDYAQIEMRVLAMISEDVSLIESFQRGDDIHNSVASRVFRVDPKEVTKEMRRRAKVINFGIIYGMGVTALKQNLGSTRAEAQEFYDQYFVTFPKIANYFEEVKKNALKKGYTETLFGRRRQFPNLRSHIPFMKAMAERMAMNAPLQGTAADFVKIAMRDADHAITKAGLAVHVELILQVHDELIYEVKNDKEIIAKATKVIKRAMEEVARGTKGEHVPMLVESKEGKRWGSMK